MAKKIVFITGTRADYGKIKGFIKESNKKDIDVHIYVTGMHLLEKFGSTYHEIEKDGFNNLYLAWDSLDYSNTPSMSKNISRIVYSLSLYIETLQPDIVVVHGDRIEALAGAIVGALNNISVVHIEGGELSGTIDDSLRHAITKLSHIHLVANSEAKKRVMQLGEPKQQIYVVGSADIDSMLYASLPTLAETVSHYDIPFLEYGIVLFHPVTTEYNTMKKQAEILVEALLKSEHNYIVIYPNNDLGSHFIIDAYNQLQGERFRIFPSIRFEYFLTLLKHAQFIIGNSSAGIREAGIYDIKTIDIGTRQHRRYNVDNDAHIFHVDSDVEQILEAIRQPYKGTDSFVNKFGNGDSCEHWSKLLDSNHFWQTAFQKRFVDMED